jgi:hypothetical protein
MPEGSLYQDGSPGMPLAEAPVFAKLVSNVGIHYASLDVPPEIMDLPV